MPEPVNSVVLGVPESFQAEHSEHESELVTVKPVATGPARTNLMITTTLGHRVTLLLISAGEKTAGTQTVDGLLRYGRPAGGSFTPPVSKISDRQVASLPLDRDSFHGDWNYKILPGPAPN